MIKREPVARPRVRRSMHLVPAICVAFCLIHCSAASAQHQPGKLPPLPLDDPIPDESPGPAIVEPTDAATTGNQAADAPIPVACAPRTQAPCETALGNEPAKTLGRRLERLLKNYHLIGASVGILAVAYPEGQVLYEKNANEPVNPASVTKLFTAAAAIAHFGLDKTFDTLVYRQEADCGRLYLKGGGDPGLSAAELASLAGQVKKAGIDCVEELVYDTDLFDDQNLPPHFEEKESDAHWRPHVGALGFEDGAVSIHIEPGKYVDAAPRVELDPRGSAVMVDNRATTTEMPGEEGLAVSVSTLKGRMVISISGQIDQTKEQGVRVRKAMPDPNLFSAWFFQDSLASRGVKVKADRPTSGRVPAGAREVARLTGDPLRKEIKRMQLWSKNFVAEQLLKLMGQGRCTPLTFACGLEVLHETLVGFGVGKGCARLENASGLFDANRVSPAQTVRLLIEAANRGEAGKLFVEALPEGHRSGTLKERMSRIKPRIKGKTGTLDFISSLAGYIDRGNGRYVAFAIFFTDAKASVWRLRKLQDRIVELLAMWSPSQEKKSKAGKKK